MKYCIIANLRLETPAKQDTLHNDITARIDGKEVWGDVINSKGQDEGYPSNSIAIRFDNEADMNDLYDFIKAKLEKGEEPLNGDLIERLSPNAAGTYSELGIYPTTPPTHYDKVNEIIPDENDTYIRNTIATGAYQTDTYGLSAPSGTGTINSVTVYARLLRWAQRVYYKLGVYTHSNLYESTEIELTNYISYETKSHIWTTNPYTESAWTWDEINALEIGIALRGDDSNGDQGRCTQVYVEVGSTASLAIEILSGTASKHSCPHDEQPPRPCIITEEFVKE